MSRHVYCLLCFVSCFPSRLQLISDVILKYLMSYYFSLHRQLLGFGILIFTICDFVGNKIVKLKK